MKKLCLLITAISLMACGNEPEAPSTVQEDVSPDFYFGDWTLDIDNGKGAGWLEVRKEDGFLDADLL